MWKHFCAISALVIVLTAHAADEPAYPIAEKRPVELEEFGNVRVDNYFWLKERDNPEVIEYLEAENRYADAMLARSSGLQKRLIEEMKSRIKQDDSSAPYGHGDYFYYERYEAGKEYPIFCRRKGDMSAAEEVLLDVNEIAGDQDYFSVRGVKVSPDHKTLAYGFDTVGRRFYDLRFIDLETGRHLEDAIDDVTPNFEWSADGQSIVYVRQDPQTLRWYQAYRHDLGDKAGDDTLLYEESDETFSIFPYKSLSGKFIYLMSNSTLATEVRYMPADKADAGFRVFLPREGEHEYFVADGMNRFYIVSNDGAENFQIMETPIDNPARSEWEVVVPNRDDVLVEGIDVFAGHVVISGMSRGSSRLEILDRKDNSLHTVPFEEDAFLAYTGDNYEYERNSVRFVYESMTTPESVFDYDFEKRASVLVKRKEVPGFSPGDYYSERLYAEARDGTMVPVTLVYRKGMKLDGDNPLLQYGYGSYGSSIEPGFSSNLVSLLDRGFIFAIAHIRGGSEMGRQWYYEGRQLKKMNTFTDFIDVSKFLIKEGYTSPAHLYARGGSAGGLLMGAVVNMAPELYNGVTTRVPFVDVVTTMLDDSIPLTSSEWDEWGDPRDKRDYEYMLSYSPYDQIKRQDYPNILVTTGLHDSQVQYWEPAKWVARLRDMKTDDNLLILKTDMQAGHSGKTGRFQKLEDDALYYTFFLQLEGLTE
jgi:oligopeptidase B